MSAMTNLDSPASSLHRLREVLRLRLVEVEDDRQVAALAEFLAQPLQDCDPAFGEPPEQQHALSTDGVDDVADFLVVEQQIDELCDLDVVNGDLRRARESNDQVLLFCCFAELHVPRGDAVDAAAREVRVC